MTAEPTWRPMSTIPDGEPVRLKFACGREGVGEYWEPPPVEIDPDQSFGGLAIECVGSFGSPTAPDDLGEAVGWAPLG